MLVEGRPPSARWLLNARNSVIHTNKSK